MHRLEATHRWWCKTGQPRISRAQRHRLEIRASRRPEEGLDEPEGRTHGQLTLTLKAGQVGILGLGLQQVWQPGVAVPKSTALGEEWGVIVGKTSLPSCQPWPPVPRLPYPPKPHQDPVGLCPRPLLIRGQEAPHHGNTPVRAQGWWAQGTAKHRMCRAGRAVPQAPLTVPRGSAPPPAGSVGSTRSWPGPASGHRGCLWAGPW